MLKEVDTQNQRTAENQLRTIRQRHLNTQHKRDDGHGKSHGSKRNLTERERNQ